MNSQAASINAPRLAELVGAAHVVTANREIASYTVDGLTPAAGVQPKTAEEISEILRFAAAEQLAVIPTGASTKLGIGMPPRKYDLALETTRMNRVIAYDPCDLTLSVEPGVPYAEVARQLSEKGQFLPLAPAFAERATIGGIVAAGVDSPLRHGYGGMRDYILGMEFVTGAGAIARSGGTVVKNVTGYDTHKVLVGSLGTLAVITRINFRTFPVPPEEGVFTAAFSDAAGALGLLERIAKSQLQLRMVEMFSPTMQHVFLSGGGRKVWVVAIAAGEHAAVERHRRELEGLAREGGAISFDVLDEQQTKGLLGGIREFPRATFDTFPAAIIFRIAVLPSAIASLIRQIEEIGQRRNYETVILVRAVGVVYAALLPSGASEETRLAACRELMEGGIAVGGRPMIEWCPVSVKREMSIWPPVGDTQPIAERLKKAFDPHGVLAPGRFVG